MQFPRELLEAAREQVSHRCSRFDGGYSISHGTHITDDLIEAFTSELDSLGISYESREAWGDDDDYLHEYLWTRMNLVAPAGYYFGASEGDGSDFGFWPIEDQDYFDASEYAENESDYIIPNRF